MFADPDADAARFAAIRRGLLTTPYVLDAMQAATMIEAGADVWSPSRRAHH